MGATYKNTKSIIHYILTKQDLKLRIENVRAYRETNCVPDKNLFVAKILFPYMHPTKDKHEEKKENTVTMVYKSAIKYGLYIK